MPGNDSITYKDAGVDIDAGEALVARIAPAARATSRPGSGADLGGFGGLFDLKAAGFRDPVLVAATDGVGTKLKIAIETGLFDGIGQDLVAMCVNDIVVQGAEPLFFLDYYASGKLDVDQAARVIESIARACKESGCALIGGETAEMPGVYALADYDIAGFIVGVVERADIIDGRRVVAGDVLLGLPSSGLHTNGYSLVRHIAADRELGWQDVLPGTDAPLADLLLQPHRSYLAAVTELRNQLDVRALAHITGGGLIDNIPRVLPAGLAAEIDRTTWTVPPIFLALQEAGGIHPEEMWRTFNMGIGMVAIVPPEDAARVTRAAGLPVHRIGRVVTATTAELVQLL